ncbi:MAG: nuclear transport factor 2 (NTF2) superfamily protein [Cryomorphaceae bacterium]|jgi:nuclear transport factor 2 (NTF2) superfamily protein
MATRARLSVNQRALALAGNRIAVRFAYEWQDASANWFRSYGNENWEFNPQGLMQVRYASINDLQIKEADRLFRWPQGRRPDDHPGLSGLGL